MIQLLLLCINNNNNNYTQNTNDSIQNQQQQQKQRKQYYYTSKRLLQKGTFQKQSNDLPPYNQINNNNNKKYFIKRTTIVVIIVTIWLLFVGEYSMTWMIVLVSRQHQQQRKRIFSYKSIINNNNNNNNSIICNRFHLYSTTVSNSSSTKFTCHSRGISTTGTSSTTGININSRTDNNKFRIVGSVSAFTIQYPTTTFSRSGVLTTSTCSSNHFQQLIQKQQVYQNHIYHPKQYHYSTTSTARMGIKGFRGWFETQFPTAIISVPISKFITDSAKTKQKQQQHYVQQQGQQQHVQQQTVHDKDKKKYSSSKTTKTKTKTNLSTIKENQFQKQKQTSKTKRQQKHLQSTIGSQYTIQNDTTTVQTKAAVPATVTATKIVSTPPNTSTAAATATATAATRATTLPPHVDGIRHNNNKEYFDHVLIDVNQLLHQVVRKSRTNGHGITLLMKELDLIISSLACPIQSLVLAIDGAPSSAKIKTQRIRRYNTVNKSSKKIISYSKHISQTYDTIRLIENQLLVTNQNNQQQVNDQQVNGDTAETKTTSATTTTNTRSLLSSTSSKLLMNKRNLKRKLESKKQKEESSFRTLCLTPGTDYMNEIEQAILYWSYQRLSPRRSTSFFTTPSTTNSNSKSNSNSNGNQAQQPQIEIYLSSSSVPGEGEVKLLEWIYNHMTPKFTNIRSLYNNNNNATATTTPIKTTTGGGRSIRRGQQQRNNNNNNNSNNNDSIAILGGDSDLVLEGLVVPIYYTPNIFILLPDENKRYLSVSIWETTRCIQQQILLSIQQQQQKQHHQQQQQNKKSNISNPISTTTASTTANSLSLYDIQNIRYDLALLLILNGNDYLPKLRGTSGFQRLYHTYLREQGIWRTSSKNYSNNGSTSSANHQGYIINPVTMEYNIQFCLQYFTHLAKSSANKFLDSTALSKSDKASMSPLQQLHKYIGTGLLPSPLSYKIYYDDDDERSETAKIDTGIDDDNDDDMDDDSDNDDDGNSNKDGDQIQIQIRLGTSDMDDYYTASIWYPARGKIQIARQKLAQLAIRELINGGDYNNEEDDDDNDNDNNADDDDDDDDTASDDIVESKKHNMAPMDAGLYLYGLLWNIQTYQDGVCADYGYDYGKRRGPTAHDIVDYFKNIQQQEKQKQKSKTSSSNSMMTISIDNVASSSSTLRNRFEKRSQQQHQKQQTSVQTLFTPPVSAGVSCLAALPKQYKHLVPEPYRYLSDETVESVFKRCIDPVDDAFDIKLFEYLVEEQVQCLRDGTQPKTAVAAAEDWHNDNDNKNDDYWTVLSLASKPLQNPYVPPKPFSERFNTLPTNDRMSMRRVTVQLEPNERLSTMTITTTTTMNQEQNPNIECSTSTVGREKHNPLLQWDTLLLRNVDDITQYKTAFDKANRKKNLSTVTKSLTTSTSIDESMSESITLQPDTNIIISEEYDDDIDVVTQKVMNCSVDTNDSNNQSSAKVVTPTPDQLNGTKFLMNRMKEFNIIEPSRTILRTKDGVAILDALNCLKRDQLIGNFSWTSECPSDTKFASCSPHSFTHITLSVSQQLSSRPILNNDEMMINNNNNDTSSSPSSTSFLSERVICLTYAQDYLMVKFKKKRMQQHLASLALQDLLLNVTTKDDLLWNDLTFKEIHIAFSEMKEETGKHNDTGIGIDNNDNTTKSDLIVVLSNPLIQRYKQRLELYNIQDLSKIIPTTVDGTNAKELLNQLINAKIIDEITWTVQGPSKSEFASYAPEQYYQHCLCIQSGKTFNVNNDSDNNNKNNNNMNDDNDNSVQRRYVVDQLKSYHSKQTIHHHLSSLAIQDLISKVTTTATTIVALQNGGQVQHWTNRTRDDIVNALLNDKKIKKLEQELLLEQQQQQQQQRLQSNHIQEM